MTQRRTLLLGACLAACRPAWAANAKTPVPPRAGAAALGVYVGPGCRGVEQLQPFVDWLGRRPDRGSDFFSDASWKELLKSVGRGTRCWQPVGLPMSFGLPMLPKDKSSTLAQGAKGDYDAHFREVGETLVAHGFDDAIVRPGWEFNHEWFAWSAKRDPRAWVAYWRRIVETLRSVEGARFRFDWCVGWADGKMNPADVYPGDDVVDIVGMDIYNVTWNPLTPTLRWAYKLNARYGLKWHRDFAAEHGKPMSYPEWGTGQRPDGRGGGDDPYFIRKMTAWIAENPVAYHNYWDYPARDFHAKLSDGSKPEAGQAFLKVYGGAR